MIPYFEKHGTNQYNHDELIQFGYNIWVMAKPLGYLVQFHPYDGKDVALVEYGDISFGLGASVVAHLLNTLSPPPHSNHIVMDNFFTSTKSTRYFQSKSIAATGTVCLC